MSRAVAEEERSSEGDQAWPPVENRPPAPRFPYAEEPAAGAAPIRVLLVEDNRFFARMLTEALEEPRGERFEVDHVETLQALSAALVRSPQVIVLDLTLPDGSGLETLERVRRKAGAVPVVVLTGLDDDQLAVRAVQAGAQDFLVKGKIDPELLRRSLRYAIERHRLLEEVRALSLIDELTGLGNRRGFNTLAAQQLKVSDRTGRPMDLIYADLDGLKAINDTLGHREGDRALVDAARSLRDVCRGSDIVARMGGDEFAALVLEAAPDHDVGAEVVARLEARIAELNAGQGRPYRLAMSIGVERYLPGSGVGLDELIRRADARMYAAKKTRKP